MLSIRWRLTIFNAVVIVAIGGLLLGILVVVTVRAVTSNVRETVQARTTEATRLIETGTLPNPAQLAQLGADDARVNPRCHPSVTTIGCACGHVRS